MSTNDDTKCHRHEIIIDDDGSGGYVTIPTFIMVKQDAETIIAEVKDRDSIVQMEMSWSVPHSVSKLQYVLWTVRTSRRSGRISRSRWGMSCILPQGCMCTMVSRLSVWKMGKIRASICVLTMKECTVLLIRIMIWNMVILELML